MGSAVIFQGNKVKTLKPNINIGDAAFVLTGTDDPTSVAQDAPRGSLYIKTDDGRIFKKLDNGSSTNWSNLSSGSSLGINYILNPDAEVNTSGWVTYADAAASRPVNGTGGSPTVTWTRSTSSPLRGSGSFLFTKDAANRQGEGVSYDFVIDSADQAKVLVISSDFAVASGTYDSGDGTDDSDLIAYIYDVTNAVLIEPDAFRILEGVGVQCQFQSSSNSVDYRLILHVATTSSSAYTCKFDNFFVGPKETVRGPVVSDWTSYTPTFEGFGTVTGMEMFYRRVGDSVLVKGAFTAGTVTAAAARISLPGVTISATAVPNIVQVGTYARSAVGGPMGTVLANGNTGVGNQTWITLGRQDGSTAGLSTALANAIVGTGETIAFTTGPIPISGWSSNQVVSSDQGTRAINVLANTASATITGSASSISWTETVDNTASFDGTIFTAKESAMYSYSAAVRVGATYTSGQRVDFFAQKNGSGSFQTSAWLAQTAAVSSSTLVLSGDVQLNAGETLRFQISSDGTTPSFSGGAAGSTLSISKKASPQQIAASEVVAASVFNDTQSLAEDTTTTLALGTVDVVTHSGMVDTANDRIIAPVSGKYLARAKIYLDATPNKTNALIALYVRKNGGSDIPVDVRYVNNSGASTTFVAVGEYLFSLNAGDYVDFRGYKDVNTGASSDAINTSNSIYSLTRIGGVQ